MTDKANPQAIMQLGFGYWGSKAFLTAVELGLFTELAKAGPLNADAIRERFGLHVRGTRDFLDTMVALGMLERDAQGHYDNTVDTAFFLDRNKPTYLGGMLEMSSQRLYGFWGNLMAALKTGEPQNEAKDNRDFFGELYSEPKRLKVFLEAMTGVSLGAAHAIAQKFPWKDCQNFIDVGVAQGAAAVALVNEHPHLTGVGYDLAPVQSAFEEYVAKHGVTERLKFHAGDFFKDEALPKADVVVMGHILHDWDLEKKKMLLAKAHAALPEGGALIVYEALIDDERRRNVLGLLMSLNMLIETPGGFDYTGADCCGWMEEVGFASTRVEHLAGPDFMIVATK